LSLILGTMHSLVGAGTFGDFVVNLPLDPKGRATSFLS